MLTLARLALLAALVALAGCDPKESTVKDTGAVPASAEPATPSVDSHTAPPPPDKPTAAPPASTPAPSATIAPPKPVPTPQPRPRPPPPT